jgi:nucleoside-diphosphate-sugar epimerase
MAKILVTGGTGFVGSNLILQLLHAKNEIISFDNNSRNSFSNDLLLDNDVCLIEGDITNPNDLKKIPNDIDVIYHLAAVNGTKYFYDIPEKVLQVNLKGTMNLMEWISSTNAKRIFFSSSSEVYGFPTTFPTPESAILSVPDSTNPRFSYSSSKITGEIIIINFAKSLGIDYTIARLHNAYGPKMGFEHVIPEFIRKAVNEEKFLVNGDGTESRSFCYISDIVKEIELITSGSNGKNEIFNIGNSVETTINQLISELEKIHGKKISPVYTKFDNPGTKRRVPDLSKIKKLGYLPKISLHDGLEKTYQWYENHYKNNSHS